MQAFKYIDLFEQYILGALAPQQRAEFEQRLQSEKDFAQEWADYQFILQGFKQGIRQSVANIEADAIRDKLRSKGFFEEARKQVDEVLAKEADQPTEDLTMKVQTNNAIGTAQSAYLGNITEDSSMKVQTNNLWRRWAVAAGLAGLVVAGWLLMPVNKTEVFSGAVGQEKKSLAGLVSGTNYAGSEFDSLKILCDMEKYTEARNYYNSIPLNKRGNECTYLVGMTWLYENNSLSALPYFEEIMDDDKTLGDFRAKSYFAAALCHFGLKNKEKALRTLDTLEDFLKNDENRILKLKDSGNSWIQIPDYISGYRNKSLELRRNLKNQSFPS